MLRQSHDILKTIPDIPELDDTAPWLEREVLRRPILKGIALTAGSLFAADQIAGSYIYGGTDPEITRFSDSTADYFPNTVALIWPGFNVTNATPIAAALKPTLEQYAQIATVKYADNGLQIKDLERSVVRFCKGNGFTNVIHYGHSFGGMLAVEMAARLKESGIQSDAIILDSSPKEREDVKGSFQRIGLWFMKVTNELSLNGGPGTRVVMETAGKFFTSDSGILPSFEHAVDKVNKHPISNTALQEEGTYIDLYDANDFAKHIKRTPICHLGPRHAWADRVVNDPRALHGWRDVFKLTGVECADSPKTGHANPGQHPRAYNHMLADVLRSSGIVGIEEIQRAERAPSSVRRFGV